ncbi:MAG: carboxylating nicotinate-nucleotide diphosphorylase [Deltaproteobacteria bacterium]|jgi:nicotinate-nucleotide pyrophosphorylase (carboxylating)|nr:carboxylating nicotinate-nucleotide diphosphorylase [Deltaproteobacteria bacterium]
MTERNYSKLVTDALREDLGPGDVTTELCIPDDIEVEAAVRARMRLVVSGTGPFREVFRQVDPDVECRILRRDGEEAQTGDVVANLRGSCASLLSAERTALNFLQHLSGVATLTRAFVNAIGAGGPGLLDTRKTTPGLRNLEKDAVRHGGGLNHRRALFDGILIKDNHITAAGGVRQALSRALAGAPVGMKVEIEVDNLDQLQEALEGGADIVLLDNMDPDALRRAVAAAESFYAPAPRKVLLEASGGVTLETVKAIAATGVDYVSTGALTHSAPAADLGLDFLPRGVY